jgi:hypothetical protein
VLGEAWLFLSLPLLKYAVAIAIFFHLFVIGYEESRLTVGLGRLMPSTCEPSPVGSRSGRDIDKSLPYPLVIRHEVRWLGELLLAKGR